MYYGNAIIIIISIISIIVIIIIMMIIIIVIIDYNNFDRLFSCKNVLKMESILTLCCAYVIH